jgi:NADH:ubiquinone oxidoreductase subunit C
MSKEELKSKLDEIVISAVYEEGAEWTTVGFESQHLKLVAQRLHDTEGLDFDYLFCLTCVDWKTHLTMVYHLTSTIHHHVVVLKSKLDRTHPEIETVSGIWRTAEFHEREVYDLFGVKFLHHPDLRRLFMTEEWKGWPLRKDYEDPVNMIKL